MKGVIRILPLCILLLLGGCRKPTKKDRSSRQTTMAISNQKSGDKVHSRSQSQEETPSKQNPSKKKLESTEIFEKYSTAVFMIFTSDGQQDFQGSGFFINNEGLAVSNYHVFKGTTIGKEQIKLLNSDILYSVTKVIYKSSDEDFILFRVNCNNTNYIPLASSKPRIGEKVYAIGSPKGLENTLSDGMVSQWRDTNEMQISVPIDHGSSGGALINEYGEVVGITSGTFDGESQANLNMAWSIDVVKPYIP